MTGNSTSKALIRLWLCTCDFVLPILLADTPMNNPVKPWSNNRQFLWAIGVLGLVLVTFGLGLAFLLQGGFGPGSRTSPPGVAELGGGVLLSIPCVYYVVVAHRPWTRKLWFIGVIIHCVMLLAFLISILQSRGGSIVLLPVLLVGPVTWILYAKRNTFSENPG
jgi:hypothetical protein